MTLDALVAKVRDGRLVLDVETDLAEGTEVSLVRNPSARRDERRCDLLLFVTTEDERKALYDVAERMGLAAREISGRFSDYIDLGHVHPEYRVFAAQTEMGALQVGGSATKGLLCPVETGARHIIAVGMAFGIDRGKQDPCDVLVATSVLPYDFVMIDTDVDGRLPRVSYNRVKPTPTNPTLIRLIRRYIEQTSPPFKVHFGAMLSGSAQIRCRAYRDHLAAKFNKKLTELDKQRVRKQGESLMDRVVGGEMEGVGLIATPPVEGITPWLIVKGISDFADEEHVDDSPRNRPRACENAITLVLQALKSAPLPEVDKMAPAQVEGS
jgi:adenosylhomocysteine nucleosidase